MIIPSDVSSNVITRSIDTVLAIYQGGPASSTVKNLTGRTAQEIREILEQLIEQCQTNDLSTPQQTTQNLETVKQTPLLPHVPPTTPASVLPQREQNQQQQSSVGPSLSHPHLIQTNANDYPLQFDTRNQNIPLQQIIQDNTFFPVDLSNNQQDPAAANNQPTFNNLNPSMTFASFFLFQHRFIHYSDLTGQNPSQNYTVKSFRYSFIVRQEKNLLANTVNVVSTTATTTTAAANE